MTLPLWQRQQVEVGEKYELGLGPVRLKDLISIAVEMSQSRGTGDLREAVWVMTCLS